jgi:Undecaprenyl-phosphate glucose phosphotransferase
MLKRHNQLASSFLLLTDLIGAAILWPIIYCMIFDAPFDFYNMFFGSVDGNLEKWAHWGKYLELMPWAILLCALSFRLADFYKVRRIESFLTELPDLVKGTIILALLLSVAAYWDRPVKEEGALLSREFVVYFVSVLFFWVLLTHASGRSVLRKLRRRGYNLRHVLIVGDGPLALQVCQKIQSNRWMGLKMAGYVSPDKEVGSELEGDKILGAVKDINELILSHGIDQVMVALPREHPERLHEVMDVLSVAAVDVKIVPDLTDFATLRMSVSDLDGIPLIALQETPLVGWSKVFKRVFDFVVGLICLIVFSLPMLLIALLVKLGSKGPILYTQERMGLDGRVFNIYKFRSMKQDAEKETGAVWASSDDDRRTAVGGFIRKTNLDELPQLFNVIKGDMSLVGPRPERPVFIQDFKTKIPKYMLRHRMKAGMTGWAQVNGWRGNTSLEKRIQCDLFYIENWSLWFDVRIMVMQLFRWRDRNAY